MAKNNKNNYYNKFNNIFIFKWFKFNEHYEHITTNNWFNIINSNHNCIIIER